MPSVLSIRNVGSGCAAAASWLRWSGPYATILEVALLIVALFSLLRIGLLVCFAEGLPSAGELVRILWIGGRFDLLVAALFVLPQTLRLTLFGRFAAQGRLAAAWAQAEWLCGFLLLPLLIAIEVVFFAEFGSRLNYIAFEYLVYPSEVCCNIYESYPIGTWLTAVVLFGGGLFFGLRGRFLERLDVAVPARTRFAILGGLLALAAGLWQTTATADIAITNDRVANECAGNGLYSFVYYAFTCRFDYKRFYLTIDRDLAVDRIRKRLATSHDEYVAEAVHPIERRTRSTHPRNDRNVVLILEESFGTDFVGALGDHRGLTPNFDALTAEGLLFDNFYATGNRTARALEATLTGLPPIPTESILKRDHSSNVFTLARVLAERGYERLFMTGGRGVFDGVQSFMTANGFNHFIEQADFVSPIFANAWGVCDEDLFDRAIVELDELHDGGKPFFAMLLTVSNHRPFTYPAGRIPDGKQTREDAVRYADFALGEFFRNAKSHAFYENTIFVVMGDHGARIYGSQAFPMRSYRVPVLMVLPDGDRAGSRCSTLACSLDIAPTILELLGGEYRAVFFGRDVLSLPPDEGLALMQHNHDLAILDPQGRMAVLGANRSVNCYRYDSSTFALTSTSMSASDSGLVEDCAAFFQTADELYYDERLVPTNTPMRERDRCRRRAHGNRLSEATPR